MNHLHLILLLPLLLLGCQRQESSLPPFQPRDTRAEGFVYVDSAGFHIDEEDWFPLMLNYRVESDLTPMRYYGGGFEEHFQEIESMGFNCLRVCLDVVDLDRDTVYLFSQLQHLLDAADSAHLRVMALIKPPFDKKVTGFTVSLLRRFSHCPTLWAYDFFNEPLYFDPAPRRDKMDAYRLVCQWRDMMERHAPSQLFTIAFSEPIEVFEWDPSILPVDFVEMHTYHPMRVANEMYWYSRHCGKPWMVGETALPADNQEVPYEAQARFLRQSFAQALSLGACGYGWWEYTDCPSGVNFEAQYAGLRDTAGRWKPAAHAVGSLSLEHAEFDPIYVENYHNMLLYRNISHLGRVVDAATGKGLEGAVVRGWNEDWSVGVNSFTDTAGQFELWSNDLCVHWEVSAPGYSHAKFDRQPEGLDKGQLEGMPKREREYQQIPLLEGLTDTQFFRYKKEHPTEQVGCRTWVNPEIKLQSLHM